MKSLEELIMISARRPNPGGKSVDEIMMDLSKESKVSGLPEPDSLRFPSLMFGGKYNINDFIPFAMMMVSDFEFYKPRHDKESDYFVVTFKAIELAEKNEGRDNNSFLQKIGRAVGLVHSVENAEAEYYRRCFRFIMNIKQSEIERELEKILYDISRGKLFFRIQTKWYKPLIDEDGYILRENLKPRPDRLIITEKDDHKDLVPDMKHWPVIPDYNQNAYIIRDPSTVEFFTKFA